MADNDNENHAAEHVNMQNVAEVHPEVAAPPPEEPDHSKDAVADEKPSAIPGWPQDRWHPVYGRRSFKDPNEFYSNGGDEGDWRFKRGADADAARTETEAQIAYHYNMRRKAEQIDEQGLVPVSNSVQAHERAESGYPEIGVVLPKKG